MFKKLTIFTVVTVLLLSIATSAYAYTSGVRYAFNSLGFSDPHHIYYKYYKYGARDYSYYVDTGAKAWSGSPAPVTLYAASSYSQANIVVSSNLWGNTGWDGLTSTISNNKYQIKVNEDGNSTGNESELVAHEMGHCHGLDDVEPKFKNLMRASGYNGSPYPTQDEVDGLNARY